MTSTSHSLGSSASRPNVSINGELVSMELDTGAAVSIVSLNAQKKYLHDVKMNKFNVVLCTYTSEKMLVVSCYNKQVKTLKLYVVD